MVLIHNILKMNLYLEEYLIKGNIPSKLIFIDNGIPVTQMRIEFISFVYFSIIKDNGFNKRRHIFAIKQLSIYVDSFNNEVLKKHYENFKKISDTIFDSKITLYEYKVFQKFSKFNAEELLKILAYLTYNNSLSISSLVAKF
uniref:hypothetical protein n=1 Tax=Aliarcobacter sp. TaxID=2321116 RepID=UPI004047AA56